MEVPAFFECYLIFVIDDLNFIEPGDTGEFLISRKMRKKEKNLILKFEILPLNSSIDVLSLF